MYMIVIDMIMIQMNVMPIAIYALKFLTMTSIKLQNETMPSGSALPLSRRFQGLLRLLG